MSDTGHTKRGPNAYTSVPMTGHQARLIAEFCDGDTDEICVGYFDRTTDEETGEVMLAGLYVWSTEYPEEGRVFLSPDPLSETQEVGP